MRRRSTIVACIVLTLASLAPAADITQWHFEELGRQWKAGVPEDPALRIPHPITRDERVEEVSLKDAIAIALENNPGIAAQRLEPARQGAGILQAQATFDPVFSNETGKRESNTPNASSLAGTTTSRIDDRYSNFHLFKTLRSGTLATIDLLNDRLDNNARYSQLRPQYSAALNLSLVQPLLRNFGWDFSYLVVRAAEQTADAALYQYEAALANFVELVIEAYWNVVSARDNLEVQRQSKALADRTVEENEARVRVGLLPPVAVLEAQADAKSREESVLIAENTLAVARQQLAQLAFYRPDGTFVPRTLEPTEEAVPETVDVNLDDTLAVALGQRPEIGASARDVQVQQLNEKIAGNGRLPRLDMVGSYGLNGISGNGRTITSGVITTTPSAFGINHCTMIAPPTAANPQGIFICNATARSSFTGPANEAYDRLNQFQSYSFGVQLQVPLSNALARGQWEQSRIALEQAELNHRELLSRVTLEARQTVSDVLTTRQRISTSRVARELAEENLRNQQKRHDVGMATTKDLLDFQTRLTSARAAEVAAKTDHAIAVARWRRARGQLLEHYQVIVEHPATRSTPWFARF